MPRSFVLYGTGAWFLSSSGTGTADDPFIPTFATAPHQFSSAFSSAFR